MRVEVRPLGIHFLARKVLLETLQLERASLPTTARLAPRGKVGECCTSFFMRTAAAVSGQICLSASLSPTLSPEDPESCL